MKVINVYEAKTNFSKLLERAAGRERIIIGKAGKPLVRFGAFFEYQSGASTIQGRRTAPASSQ